MRARRVGRAPPPNPPPRAAAGVGASARDLQGPGRQLLAKANATTANTTTSRSGNATFHDASITCALTFGANAFLNGVGTTGCVGPRNWCGWFCGYGVAPVGYNLYYPVVDATDACCRQHDLALGLNNIKPTTPRGCTANRNILTCLQSLPQTVSRTVATCNGGFGCTTWSCWGWLGCSKGTRVTSVTSDAAVSRAAAWAALARRGTLCTDTLGTTAARLRAARRRNWWACSRPPQSAHALPLADARVRVALDQFAAEAYLVHDHARKRRLNHFFPPSVTPTQSVVLHCESPALTPCASLQPTYDTYGGCPPC